MGATEKRKVRQAPGGAPASTVGRLQGSETKVKLVDKEAGGTAERAGTPFPSPANRRWPGLGFWAPLRP